jgi:hypothetical protein
MKLAISVLVFIAMVVLCASYALAQTPADPTGHWEGTITAPFGEVAVEVDLRRNADGRVTGTYTGQAENISGLPFRQVVLDGRLLTLKMPGAAGGQFMGTLIGDGRTYSGAFSLPQGSAPFTLTRMGEPRPAAAFTSPAVGRELEGRWAGALDVNGRELRLVLTLANQTDGTVIATIESLDEGIELPVTVAQRDREVTVTVPMNGAVYRGAISAGATQIAGTYNVQGTSLPLILRPHPAK